MIKVLVAEDDFTSRYILTNLLSKWGYEPTVVSNGQEAWERLKEKDSVWLALLDWMMPEMDGIEVCRRFRETSPGALSYIILLTVRTEAKDIVAGLSAGADDYLTKPYDVAELRARLGVGRRILELQTALASRIAELQDALDHIKSLQSLLPICKYCHKIQTDEASWERIEKYLEEHTEAQIVSKVCPECMKKHYLGPLYEKRPHPKVKRVPPKPRERLLIDEDDILIR